MATKYDRVELIGTGTFGKVYLVRSKSSNQQYVLKEIDLTNMSGTEKQLALTEVTVLARCRHKNIIRYKEAMIEQENGILSIVMEYAEYGDMYAAIKKQRGVYFQEKDVLSWFIQITLALQYIHNHNILHRDLKTQNIFLTGDKMIKVGDFGIAKVLKEDQELARTAIGTPYYLSPEICQRKPYNSKSDIWALGCILFEITALVHPFQGQNFHQLVKSILKAQYKELPSHCSTLVQDLVEVLLDLDPGKRPSADEILAIPALQPHLHRYLDTFSSSESMSIIDTMVAASMKKNDARRFSSNDILDAPRLSSLKRTASVSADGKNTTSQKPSILSGASESPKPSKIFSNFYRQSKRNSGSRPSSSQEDVKNETPRARKSVSTNRHETPEDQHTQKDSSMKQTYSLWKKAVEKGERAIGMIGDRMFKGANYNHQRSSTGNEVDCGYQSGEPSSQTIPESHRAEKKSSSANPKQLDSPSKLCQDNVMALSVTGVDFIDDVFDMDLNKDNGTLHCPHTSQCQCCIFDTLWKNRIKTTGDIDDKERSRLKRNLQRVLGTIEFDHLYTALSKAWNSEPVWDFSLHSITRQLNFEQRQHIPLLMQLLQMDFIAITRSPFYLGNPI